MRWLSSHFHLYIDLPASASGMLISEPMELRGDEFLEESSAFQWNYRFNSSATTMTYAHSNPTTCIFEEWNRALKLNEKMCQIRRALSQMSTVSPNPEISFWPWQGSRELILPPSQFWHRLTSTILSPYSPQKPKRHAYCVDAKTPCGSSQQLCRSHLLSETLISRNN